MGDITPSWMERARFSLRVLGGAEYRGDIALKDISTEGVCLSNKNYRADERQNPGLQGNSNNANTRRYLEMLSTSTRLSWSVRSERITST